MRRVLACLVAALSAQQACAVNKCTGKDGAVVYQDAPCPSGGGASVNLSGAGTAQPDSEAALYWRREAERLARQDRIETAILNRQIIIGMTAAEAGRAWGRPSRVNSSVGTYGRREQWVYRRGGARAQYVYVDDGVVTGVQTAD